MDLPYWEAQTFLLCPPNSKLFRSTSELCLPSQTNRAGTGCPRFLHQVSKPSRQGPGRWTLLLRVGVKFRGKKAFILFIYFFFLLYSTAKLNKANLPRKSQQHSTSWTDQFKDKDNSQHYALPGIVSLLQPHWVLEQNCSSTALQRQKEQRQFGKKNTHFKGFCCFPNLQKSFWDPLCLGEKKIISPWAQLLEKQAISYLPPHLSNSC